MTEKTARFLPRRRLLALIIHLIWTTTGSTAALAERGDIGFSLIAANRGSKLAQPAACGGHEWNGPIQSFVTDGKTLMVRMHDGE